VEEAARQAASLRFVNRGITAPRARARRSHLVCVILSPIPRELLRPALDRFMAGLGNPFARAVFCQIRATSADRATGAEAERHRRAALLVARSFGIAIHPEGTRCSYNWDGAALNGATEAYVILHEIAHFALAPPERRRLIDFGLGPGPDTIDRDAAEIAEVLSLLAREEDEARASLLGIVWEAQLAQPALASFLDQNWLEGLDRSAASHFSTVLDGLRRDGLLSFEVPGKFDRAQAARLRQAARAKTGEPGCERDPEAEQRNSGASLGRMRRFAKHASTQGRA